MMNVGVFRDLQDELHPIKSRAGSGKAAGMQKDDRRPKGQPTRLTASVRAGAHLSSACLEASREPSPGSRQVWRTPDVSNGTGRPPRSSSRRLARPTTCVNQPTNLEAPPAAAVPRTADRSKWPLAKEDPRYPGQDEGDVKGLVSKGYYCLAAVLLGRTSGSHYAFLNSKVRR